MPIKNWLGRKLLNILLTKTEIQDECIIYTGIIPKRGHPEVCFEYVKYKLHRLIACIVKEIPYNSSLEAHHTCKHKTCLNSSHIEFILTSEHTRIHMMGNQFARKFK